MKKLTIIALAAAAAIGLSGCEDNISDRREQDGFYIDGFVETRTGEQVYCVYIARGGSCDFGNALGLNKK